MIYVYLFRRIQFVDNIVYDANMGFKYFFYKYYLNVSQQYNTCSNKYDVPYIIVNNKMYLQWYSGVAWSWGTRSVTKFVAPGAPLKIYTVKALNNGHLNNKIIF